ncbi:MAG: 16S rRNA (guanine(966)-N(2))-methyltransferase RsmD [Alphaproteobacteria bacterium]|nr:16S rRNA (guanine(966)-N(2))-methyltransferase RsmD [Alphaproteobacteria bacterium]
MRIIGGKYRGKKLFSPTSENVRPTSDKAREALFNIMRNRLKDGFYSLKIIDVFSGSGAFALEALSQGFAKVVMVDIDVKDLQKNVKMFDAEKNKIEIVKADATKTLPLNEKFDVLFMDAPYNKGLTQKALLSVAQLLNNGALCMIELHKNEVCDFPENYHIIDERNYGVAKVVIAEFIL